MRPHDGAGPAEVAVEVDGAGQPGVALQVVDQRLDGLVALLDQRLDDRRFAQADAPRLAELPGEDLIEIGDQGGDPRLLVGPGGRRRRPLRLARPALVVGQELGELAEEIDIGRGPLAAVDEPPGAGEAHRLGLRLDGLLQARSGPARRPGRRRRRRACRRRRRGRSGTRPGRSPSSRKRRRSRSGRPGLRLAGLLAGPARRRGPDPLGEVGAADPQQQGDLDRVQARRARPGTPRGWSRTRRRRRPRPGPAALGGPSAGRGPRLRGPSRRPPGRPARRRRRSGRPARSR